jgi:hypothetical protein
MVFGLTKTKGCPQKLFLAFERFLPLSIVRSAAISNAIRYLTYTIFEKELG